ncbi:hypothetical protein [Mesorhizobium sp. WSM3860]|uniref:hypothetical protein n=1 Tax=Mesorhizobium sp. WSM3860 TaxID=2029403 RepID=UPI000BAF45A8|nr:hypothetical protein [Mesorhizobium sp. WSM3860]PBC02517.1 hypothetical protein CK220_20630 [Mesorhizobium sp. WSM3860]
MPRFATIITGDDGAEIVSAIGEFESFGVPPRTGRVEPVAPGVRIGMVRGGAVDAAGGFGFPRQGLGLVDVSAAAARLKAVVARAPRLPISPQMEEMSDSTERGAVPPTSPIGLAACNRAASPKPNRAKPRKKPARKAAKARALRSAGTSVADAAANG